MSILLAVAAESTIPERTLDWRFVTAYLLIGAILIGVELYGVIRKRRGDTISEMWWAVQERHPIAARVVLGFFFGWLILHLLVMVL